MLPSRFGGRWYLVSAAAIAVRHWALWVAIQSFGGAAAVRPSIPAEANQLSKRRRMKLLYGVACGLAHCLHGLTRRTFSLRLAVPAASARSHPARRPAVGSPADGRTPLGTNGDEDRRG